MLSGGAGAGIPLAQAVRRVTGYRVTGRKDSAGRVLEHIGTVVGSPEQAEVWAALVAELVYGPDLESYSLPSWCGV